MSPLKSFLELPYDELERRNLEAADKAVKEDPEVLEAEYRKMLRDEKSLKAVTVCFSDIEGRFQMVDFDKLYFLDSADNLTFDGSSIRGFSKQQESDLRLEVDWASIRWLPADVFGPGKVIFFASVKGENGDSYPSDLRGRLRRYTDELRRNKKIEVFVAGEVEGMLVKGQNAEQLYDEAKGFELASMGGYFHTLPLGLLRTFIDAVAEAQRAMGFRNEKDHAEVAPSQFELNFRYAEAVRACDTVQLYKLVCRQIAANMGLTATFLPKPVSGINGNGMHWNVSMSQEGRNLFYDRTGESGLSKVAWDFIQKVLNHAPELSLIMNPSVNAYRRLDPHFEAPNQIKVSAKDRSSMIRIPAGNEKSTRAEVRSVAPDANPYLLTYALLKTFDEGEPLMRNDSKRDRARFLPGTIGDAIRLCKASEHITRILGEETKAKYLECKQAVADRSPHELGKRVKLAEVTMHHEVTTQILWNEF